jgi:EAL domain-containing protein (putative c-di-GMP-specific phosphodiesterase class I)
VVSFLQPIVSVRQREVRLVEALARRIDPGGIVRTPSHLFAEAAAEGTQCEFAARCRIAALRAFQGLLPPSGTSPTVLSINMDIALVRDGAAGAHRIHSEVVAEGVSPRHVALEILESALPDALQLEAFCQTARELGYLLALDDMGTGHSNLERIPRLQPDILKVDRGLIHGISQSYHQQEVFRALLSLGHQIGALLIAEGVETEADVEACLVLGCDLFQGYYFGRPWNPNDNVPLYDEERLHRAGHQLRASATKRLHKKRAQHRRSEQAMRVLLAQVKSVGEPVFDSLLQSALSRLAFVEALYVLDENGVQVTDTVQRSAAPTKAL